MKRDLNDLRILMLVTDAFGGFGGIAQYKRDFLRALCELSEINRVDALPRVADDPTGELPDKLNFVVSAAANPLVYASAAWRTGFGCKPHLVVCGHLNLLPVAWLVARFHRVPLMLMIYGIEAWQPTGRVLSDRLAKRVDLVVSISRLTLSRFQQWTHVSDERTALLPNAVHLQDYGIGPKCEDLQRQYGIAGKTVLMTLGRMVGKDRAKGFDEVIQAMPEVLKRRPDLVYLAVGDGGDRPRLEQLARDRGVADRVIFPGRIPEDRKADHYRLADAYVMPSAGEGFGFVLLEAMACGIPVVASRVDGGFEAVREGLLGKAIDPSSPRETVEAILQAVSRPKKIPEGLDYFSYDRFRDRLRGIISMASNGSSRPRLRDTTKITRSVSESLRQPLANASDCTRDP